MGKTSIEWTDHSWPVINGCRRVSAGCENCYAERLTATRLSKTPKYQGLAVFGKNGPRWTGKSRLWVPSLDMPLRLKQPSRIFVADMGDLFYEAVSNDEIASVFGVMAACPQHTFQVLTKRPERARQWFRSVTDPAQTVLIRGLLAVGLKVSDDAINRIAGAHWPLPNVWLGVSVEDQATADERIPVLLELPAALRFVSAEPLLEWVDLGRACVSPPDKAPPHGVRRSAQKLAALSGLDWVIVGGESGPGARPCAMEWLGSVVDQCRAAGVPAFVKQLGACPVSTDRVDLEGRWAWRAGLVDKKGGDPAEWPEDLRVREFPAVRINSGHFVDAGGEKSTGAPRP